VTRRLDLRALDLQEFAPGAVVRTPDGLCAVGGPLRGPTDLPATLRAPIGTLADKVRLARLVLSVRTTSARALLRGPDGTTLERLVAAGFGPVMVESFWRPLFAGIRLDPDLEVSRRRFDVVLTMLATGSTAVPAAGGDIDGGHPDRCPGCGAAQALQRSPSHGCWPSREKRVTAAVSCSARLARFGGTPTRSPRPAAWTAEFQVGWLNWKAPM
jgi:hypothetical protein